MTTTGVEPVEIRRNGRLSAGIGLIAAVMTVAYLNRAAGTGSFVDWLLCGLMGLIAVWQLLSLVDARTPLLVADEQGVRIRLAHDWLGVPWAAIEQVLVEHRDAPLRDGRLILRARNIGNALEGLESAAQREVRWQRRLHGAPLAVPLSWATVVSSDDLVGDLRAMAGRRADVTLVTGRERAVVEETHRETTAHDRVARAAALSQPAEPADVAAPPAPEAEPALAAPAVAEEAVDEPVDVDEDVEEGFAEEQPARTPLAARMAELLSRLGGRAHDVDAEGRATEVDDRVDDQVDGDEQPVAARAALPALPEPPVRTHSVVLPQQPIDAVEPVTPAPVELPEPVDPVRAARAGVRAEVTSEIGPRRPRLETDAEMVADQDGSEVAADHDDLVVIDGVDSEAVPEPVIGPEVRAARERAGLSIDELSARTMVRPHVLEGIEVDDFEPCGGDFYARGHLTTLSRYLGLDAEALIAEYDDRYSHAPINARRVFEAELATGLGGGMRATSAGPRWSLIAAAVLSLLMIWGVARFFTDSPAEITAPSSSVSDSAEMTGNETPITSPLTKPSTLTVIARGGDTRVTVTDRSGDVVWKGHLAQGTRRELVGIAPFTVEATHGAWTFVHLDDAKLGGVGIDLNPATRTVGGDRG